MPILERVMELMKLIERDLKTPRAPEKYMLAKRLSQCLHRELPDGLHQYTLKIYEIILHSSHKSGQLFEEDIAIYSAGLFPFFEYASPENKRFILKLIDEDYIPLIAE